MDAGALIGVERGAEYPCRLIDQANAAGLAITVPAPVLAQVWRRGDQVRLARLLKVPGVAVRPFDEREARAVGLLLAAAGAGDVVDGSVVVCAVQHGDRIVTSDPQDILRLHPRAHVIAV